MIRLLVPLCFVVLLTCANRASAEQDHERRVSLAVDRAPLTQVTAELTRQSGTTHRVAGPEGTAQRIVLYCRNQPAEVVRAAIGRLLGWRWSQSTVSGVPVFTLAKGLDARRLEEALRARFWQQYGSAVQAMVKAAQDPEYQAAPGSLLGWQVKDCLHGGVLRTLGSLPPDVMAEVTRGRPYAALGLALPGSFRQSLKQLFAAYAAEGGSQIQILPSDTLRLEVARAGTGRPLSLQLTVVRGGETRVQFNSAHSGTMVAQARAQERRPDLAAELRDHPELGAALPRRPPLEWPAPPSEAPSEIGWHLSDLSRRIDLPIAAHCFPDVERTRQRDLRLSPPWPSPNTDGKRLLSVLQELDETLGFEWKIEAGWLILRYRQWFWESARPAHTVGPRSAPSAGSAPGARRNPPP